MRVVVMAAVVMLGCLTGMFWGIPAAGGDPLSDPAPASAGEPQGLATLASPPIDGVQQFTVVDSATRAMAVYHVDLKSGQITLKSVRNLRWDLQLEDFNSVAPKAREVRIQVQGH